MRPKERIPIFLKKVDFDKLQDRWDIDISQDLRGTILSNKIRRKWLKDPDQRFGQLLINLELIPDKFNIWEDEEYLILDSQGIPKREFIFWGRQFDKHMNKLPKIEHVLLKDMETSHIKAILKGNYCKSDFYLSAFKEELAFRKPSIHKFFTIIIQKMRKINCIICDRCRKVCHNPIIVKGKKRELHFCSEECKCKAKH